MLSLPQVQSINLAGRELLYLSALFIVRIHTTETGTPANEEIPGHFFPDLFSDNLLPGNTHPGWIYNRQADCWFQI
jgi:hypothetical protein